MLQMHWLLLEKRWRVSVVERRHARDAREGHVQVEGDADHGAEGRALVAGDSRWQESSPYA